MRRFSIFAIIVLLCFMIVGAMNPDNDSGEDVSSFNVHDLEIEINEVLPVGYVSLASSDTDEAVNITLNSVNDNALVLYSVPGLNAKCHGERCRAVCFGLKNKCISAGDRII